jgi:hypothetical protein
VQPKTAAPVASAAAGAAASPPRRPAGVFARVLGLSLLIAGAAGVVYFLAARHHATSGVPMAVPWLFLAVGYAAS